MTLCKHEYVKVIYMGLPMKLCDNCYQVEGFWSWIFWCVNFDGTFMLYEGSYLKALWYWLKGESPDY
jgi:hypothetical protein